MTHPSVELYGSDRMMLEAVRGLRGAGARVVVCLPGTGPLTAALLAEGAEVRQVDVPVLRKSSMTPRGLAALGVRSIRSAVPALRLVREVRPVAVYVSTLTCPTWPLLVRCVGVPVVVHVHEAEPSAPRLVRALLGAPLLLARTVLVNSRFAQDVLVGALPLLRHRSTVLLNGVEGPARPSPPVADLDGAGALRRLRLLYVGRLSARKGVLVAVEALERLVTAGVDAELHLLGSVYAEHQEFAVELERAAGRTALEGRVVRHGFGDVWEHLARADVVLVPSVLPEPFGNTAVEAVLAARPVVASRCGGLPEALQVASAAHLVEPGDPEALADAVRALLSDLPAAHEAALADSSRAAQLFAPVRYQRALAEAVLSAARGGPAE